MFEYLFGPVIKIFLCCCIVSAILVNTPLGRWSFEYGVWDFVFKGLEVITPKKDISLQDLAYNLTGTRSELWPSTVPAEETKNNRKEK